MSLLRYFKSRMRSFCWILRVLGQCRLQTICPPTKSVPSSEVTLVDVILILTMFWRRSPLRCICSATSPPHVSAAHTQLATSSEGCVVATVFIHIFVCCAISLRYKNPASSS
ncbi:hypothetical protein DENSPDRAFT_225909 [Dentipellis sp. KUC8613]|nr:hypothetical protein DENSPDRAFT_225909 [Dentipellis sp. KUC8613]